MQYPGWTVCIMYKHSANISANFFKFVIILKELC